MEQLLFTSVDDNGLVSTAKILGRLSLRRQGITETTGVFIDRRRDYVSLFDPEDFGLLAPHLDRRTRLEKVGDGESIARSSGDAPGHWSSFASKKRIKNERRNE